MLEDLDMCVSLMNVVWISLFVTALFLLREFLRTSNAISVTYEAALESAKLIKDWGSWMTTVSTAVIGTNGFLLNSSTKSALNRDTTWATSSVLLFGLSIVIAAWVIGSLPSVVSRLEKTPGPHNDIYEIRFFSFVPVRVGVITGLQHVFFLLGLYCFAMYIVGLPRVIPFFNEKLSC